MKSRVHYDDLYVGLIVDIDRGFNCMPAGSKTVLKNEGGFFVTCEEGRHYLDGQKDDDGYLVGISVPHSLLLHS